MGGQPELLSGKKGATLPAKVTSTAISADKQGLDVVVDSITNPVPVTGPLTDAELRAADVKITLDGETVPVTGTFFQATQPISAASLPLPTGASTETTLGTRLSESDYDTKTGSLTETAPATDTASSGLNGRLQRIAQRITSLIALLPSALVSGRLDVNLGAAPATVTANPATAFGKTITYVPVAQGAAGTTELAAASASNKHKVIGGMLTMSLAGTLKFTDGVGDLTGPMTFAANGGMVVPESPVPFIQTGAVNRALNLVTTVGAANGVIAILTEP